MFATKLTCYSRKVWSQAPRNACKTILEEHPDNCHPEHTATTHAAML